jgi:photosystem II stability/assembly factor-like uncharacterized protein
MIRTRTPFFGLLALALFILPGWAADTPEVAPPPRPVDAPSSLPDAYVKKMVWRCVGPANMGGRITAIAVNEADPNIWYVASATGGLLKTVNNGTTFDFVFEREKTISIGDVAVSTSNPNIVWVGTGENNPRNSVSYGDGVYKSTDGGKTWANMGLKDSYQIGKIAIHPKNPDVVYVGALGRLYGPNPERGLFKTTDGGKNWSKVLFVDDRTGVIDFRLDPFNPETLLVGMWERQRDEFDGFFGKDMSEWPTQDQYGPAVGHGPGGGLFKSTDGGTTWTKLTVEKTGLPTVHTGRIGLDYSRKTKGLVFAIIDTEKIGMGRARLSVYMGLTADDSDKGLVIKEAPEDGPGGKAGLKEGDIILKVDDAKTAKYDEYFAYLAKKKPGDEVKFVVKRGDKEVTIPMKLVPREETDEPKKDKKVEPQPKAGQPPVLGVIVKAEEGGVEIEGLSPGGPAEKAGLEKGTLITAVAGKPVKDQQTLRTVLAGFKTGDKVKVTIQKDGKKSDVEIVLGGRTEPKGKEGGMQRPTDRPFIIRPEIGGQRENIQDQQGKDGYQTGGLYMSKDNGDTWTRVNSLNPRPFYFSQVRVDPNDDNLLYVAGDTTLYVSKNGGKKFDRAPAREVHPDHHALWIDPRDSRHMLLGCDGGFYVTYDRGEKWDHINTVALGQFYHVAVDNRKPYRIYGGLQDNGSWTGPSHVLRTVGPVNDDWGTIQGGDGFVCRVDPHDPDIVYSESQNGNIQRHNLRTGEGGGFAPASKGNEPARRNWNTPFIVSQHYADTVYSASQYISRSQRKGEQTKLLSQTELTRTKKGSATALSESPRNPDVLWVGTDDGYVWVTKDGGQTWTNVYEKLKAAGLAGPRWVASLEASRVKDGRCYLALDAHRSNDDKPYLFVTENFGESWTNITANLPAFGSTRVLREDIVNPEILYAGTEFGIWVSINRGTNWTKLNNNLPTVAVHEVAQPTTASEIVIATHGRSIWILDVNSLRQMPVRMEGEKRIDPLNESVSIFNSGPNVRWKLRADIESMYSKNVRKFYGTNPDRRVFIDYVITKPVKDFKLTIVDAADKPIWELRNASSEVGFHRQPWSMNRAGSGLAVPAGTYRAVLKADGKQYVAAITLENDPHADPAARISVDADNRLRGEEDEGEDGWEED